MNKFTLLFTFFYIHVKCMYECLLLSGFTLQPKLTMPKCQKNVDYFLEACRKLGVDRVCKNKYIDSSLKALFPVNYRSSL